MIKLGSFCLAIVLCHILIKAEELEPYCRNIAGALFYRQSCYIFGKEILHYQSAKDMCEHHHQGFDSHLAFIQSDDVLDKLAEHTPDGKYWIGLVPKDVGQPPGGDWVWRSGYNDWLAKNINWPPGHPIVYPNVAGFVKMGRREIKSKGAYEVLNYICQIEDPENRIYRRSKNIRFDQPFSDVMVQGNPVTECAKKCKEQQACVGFSVKMMAPDYGYCMMASYSSDKKDLMKRDYGCDSYDRV